ncbi:MAG TPA: ABC transporter permease [Vicinamibacterales bacterium]|nr:ABC transporter permease [Vicinamibacterales bacterium]
MPPTAGRDRQAGRTGQGTTRVPEHPRSVTLLEPPSLRQVRPLAALRRLAGHADLIRTLAAHRIKVRYKQSRLGLLWALLQPLAMMAVFTLVVSLFGARTLGGAPYPLFAYAGLLPWTYFSTGVSTAATALTGHASLLTKVAFPREILPLTYVGAALADALVASLALVALMAMYGVAPTLHAWWAVPIAALLTLFVTAVALALSALHVRLRDVGLAMPLVLQVWLFASPVLYPLELARAHLSGSLYTIYLLNPMAGYVDGFRRAVVLGAPPDPLALALAAGVSAVLLAGAYVWFKYLERTMADVV